MNSVLAQIRTAAGAEVVTSVPARRAIALVAFVLLTAFGAHVSAPMPGTMVPVSLQLVMVLLSGMLLGPALGAAAQTMYLMAGIAGLPVFVSGVGLGYLFGPTGGYLLAFPAAAAVTGAIAARARGGMTVQVAMLTLAGTLGIVTVLAGGWAQLAVMTGDGAQAFRLGVMPFLLGDIAKLVIAVLVALRIRRRTLALV